jgi:uncharacterized protein with FMN-binding domain
MEETKKTTYTPAIIGILVIVLLAAVAVALNQPKSSTSVATDSTTASQSTDSATPAASDSTAASTGSYKDGSFTASASYSTPESTETIAVTITLKDGKVSTASVSQTPQDRESREYQQQFADNYKSEVIGKDIASIKLSKVAGSSLTSNGFNDALDSIEQQAQA